MELPYWTEIPVVLVEMLTCDFMQRALVVGLLGGIVCSLVGVLVTSLRLSFIGPVISHAAFAGGIISMFLGYNPLIGALIFSLVAAGLTGPLIDRGEINPDTSLGILFAVTIGFAFLFMGLMPYAERTEAYSLIWGSILTVTNTDLQFLMMISIFVVGIIALFYKEIQAIIFNREIALAVGLPAYWIFYGILFLTGLTVTATLQPIGGLLVFSLIITPAAMSYHLTDDLKHLFVISGVFGVFSCWVGLFLSYLFNLPSGATIVTLSAVIFLMVSVFSSNKVKDLKIVKGDYK